MNPLAEVKDGSRRRTGGLTSLAPKFPFVPSVPSKPSNPSSLTFAMTNDQNHSQTSDPTIPTPCGRTEAMELAIRTAVVAHLVVCILSLALLASLDGRWGVLWGFGVAGGLAAAIPFVILPVAAAIGFLTHLGFQGTRLSIPTLVRTLVILFEASLFGWVVVLTAITRT